MHPNQTLEPKAEKLKRLNEKKLDEEYKFWQACVVAGLRTTNNGPLVILNANLCLTEYKDKFYK